MKTRANIYLVTAEEKIIVMISSNGEVVSETVMYYNTPTIRMTKDRALDRARAMAETWNPDTIETIVE